VTAGTPRPDARAEGARVAFVQGTLPRYRVPLFAALLAAAGPGSRLIHGAVRSRHPKYTAFAGPVPFDREALPSWSPSFGFRGKLFHPILSPGLHAALARARPEVVVTEGESNLLNDLAVLAYARRRGVPYVWWGLGTIPGSRPSGLRTLLGPLLRRIVSGAAGVACYSEHARRVYVAMGADPAYARVVPNALDHRAVEADIARHRDGAAALRAEAGVPDDALVLLTVGALEPSKRIDLGIDAARRAGTLLGRPVVYWVVGDGEARGDLERHARAAGAGDRVVFWGARHEDASRFFLAADVFLLPGLGGLALNHAMQHGLPAVAGPADGTEADLLGDGRCGVLLARTDADALAGAVAGLADPGRRRALGEAARARILAGYTLDAAVAAMGGLVRDALDRSRR